MLVLGSALLSSCEASSSGPASGSPDAGALQVATPGVQLNVRRGAEGVPVDTRLEVTAKRDRLEAVDIRGRGEGRVLRGVMAEDGTRWTATGRLEPNTTYVVTTRLIGSDGAVTTKRRSFSTQPLTLDEQTYATVAPLDGETVGVGMPVIVNFDVPVTDRAAVEKHLTVTSTPRQVGSWHWLSDREVHFRPKKYWKPGSEVRVDVAINSVPAGDGVYGQESRSLDFTVGDAHIYTVDMRTYEMKVRSNGRLLRTIAITTGEQPKFTACSGIKVIIEKFASKRMNSETVGIPAGSPDAYDIDNVQWAMRVTYSGEFIHAAPWSVGADRSGPRNDSDPPVVTGGSPSGAVDQWSRSLSSFTRW